MPLTPKGALRLVKVWLSAFPGMFCPSSTIRQTPNPVLDAIVTCRGWSHIGNEDTVL